MSKVLLVAPIPTHPSATGASARLRYMAAALKSLGHEVHFMHLQQPLFIDDAELRRYWGERLHVFRSLSLPSLFARARRKLIRITGKSLHLNLPVDSYFDPEAARYLARLVAAESFDVVVVSYVFYSRLLESLGPPTRKILDTNDVFSDRYRLYRQHGQANEFFSTDLQGEGKGLNRADVILAIQQSDASHFISLTSKPVAVVGHLAPVADEMPSEENDSSVILFVGGPMGINVHGVTWFIEQVLPWVRRRVDKAELWLVGGINQRLRRPAPGVRRLGFVDAVGDLYRRAAVVINPQQFGTGLSIKSIDALRHGRPLVTTPSGARGLEDGAGVAFRQAETASEFGEAVVELLGDSTRRAALAACAAEFARRYRERSFRALEHAVIP
jgi:polysaccharide biosynthesis protein PslH